MPAITIGKSLPPRFNPNRWARNAVPVPYQVEGRSRTTLNHVLKWHGKLLFRSPGRLVNVAATGGAGERARWYACGHTSPMTSALAITMRMTVPPEISGEFYSRCLVTAVGGAALDPIDMHYGSNGTLAGDVPSHHAGAIFLLPVSANTAYEFKFSDFDGARLVSASIHEVMLPAHTLHGYMFPSVAVLQPIYDSDRDTAYDLANRAWKQQGATCVNFTQDIDADARTRTSATPANFADTSITTISANTPGIKLDLRYRNRRSKMTVPFLFKARGSIPAGFGTVKLYSSAGVELASIEVDDTVEAWFEIAADLPAIEDKLDVHIAGDGTNLLTVRAIQIYEMDPS